MIRLRSKFYYKVTVKDSVWTWFGNITTYQNINLKYEDYHYNYEYFKDKNWIKSWILTDKCSYEPLEAIFYLLERKKYDPNVYKYTYVHN